MATEHLKCGSSQLRCVESKVHMGFQKRDTKKGEMPPFKNIDYMLK